MIFLMVNTRATTRKIRSIFILTSSISIHPKDKNVVMRGQKELYDLLKKLSIKFDYHEHPPVATIDDAVRHWKDFNSGRCKNIFFRNHKGNRHYLVILEHLRLLNIHDLEKRLKQ